MTRERFQQIGQVAADMAGEIEWGDFADAQPPHRFSHEVGWLLARRGLPDALRRVLSGELLPKVEPHLAGLPDHQEPEQQAAGLIAAALKHLLMQWAPEHAEAFRILRLTLKFRRLPQPITEAPYGTVHVPSMAQQRQKGGL